MSLSEEPRHSTALHWRPAIAALVGLLFMAEFFTPLGFAHGTLYAPLVLLTAIITRHRNTVLAIGILAAVLTGIGTLVSPPPLAGAAATPIYLGNRLFSLLGIAITTAVCLFALRIHARHLYMQQQLRQSERLRALGELTGGVAHDFNNLLMVIIGNVDLLGEQLEGQPCLQSLLRTTREAADRGSELTRRLLAFARRQPLNPRVTDLRELLDRATPLMRPILHEDIQLQVTHEADLWSILIDPVELENALINLCANARDAMPDGGRLVIRTGNAQLGTEDCPEGGELAPGQYVTLAVSDTGHGIDPSCLDRVFEPFYTTKARGRGTGLGLSMVYGFARQSGGHVVIDSEPGQGTTVRLYLPRAASGPAPSPAPSGSRDEESRVE